VKASILFLQKFSDREQAKFNKLKAESLAEIEAKYAGEIARETKRLEAAITAAKTEGQKEARKKHEKELNEYRHAIAEKIAAESRALLKQRFNYPVFLYEAEHVGITATGEPDVNELYPNERQPAGGVKTCVELYREFRKNPESFFAGGPAK